MKAPLTEPHSVAHRGKPVSVIIPVKGHQELLERLEDAEDMAWLKRARQEPSRYRSLKEDLTEQKGGNLPSCPA